MGAAKCERDFSHQRMPSIAPCRLPARLKRRSPSPVDQIGFGLGPANPDAFLTALGQGRLGGSHFWRCPPPQLLRRAGPNPNVSYRCGFFGPAERLLVSQGHRVEHVPGGFRQFAPILARFTPRVMVAQAAPPEAQERSTWHCITVRHVPDSSERASDPNRLLIIETNPNLPRTMTLAPEFDNTLPVDVIDVLVEADGVPFALENPPPTDTDRAIAATAP